MTDETGKPVSGVLTGSHTPDLPPVDLLGAPVPVSIEGKAMGSRAGRPNRISAIMAAKIEDKHGGTVLQEIVRLGMLSPAELAREMVDAADEIAAITGQDVKDLRGSVTVWSLMRFKVDCLATAAPYLHAKRAPENGKGQTMRPILQVLGLAPGDLRRSEGGIDDADLIIDATDLLIEHNQGDSNPRLDGDRMEDEIEGGNASNASEVGQ